MSFPCLICSVLPISSAQHAHYSWTAWSQQPDKRHLFIVGKNQITHTRMPRNCFSCLFVYTVRHEASVYILPCAIYGLAAGLSKKAARKVAFNPLASHAINTLAKTTQGCNFIFSIIPLNKMLLLKKSMVCVLLFYFALPIEKHAADGKAPAKTPWKPTPR